MMSPFKIYIAVAVITASFGAPGADVPVFRDSAEHEIKLAVPDTAAVLDGLMAQPDVVGLRLDYVGERLTRDTYFDTDDLALYRANYVLRMRRKYDGRVALQAKRPGQWVGTVLLRDELAEDLPPARGVTGTLPPSSRVTEAVAPTAGGRPLTPMLEVFDLRHTFFAGPVDAPRRYLISLDTGHFTRPGGGREVAFAELEIELLEPDNREAREWLHRISTHLRDRFGLRRSTDSKYVRGVRALGLKGGGR